MRWVANVVGKGQNSVQYFLIYRQLFKAFPVRAIQTTDCLLTHSLLLVTQEAFVDGVNQDQTAQNMPRAECDTILSAYTMYRHLE